MSAPDYDAPAEVIPDLTHAEVYLWVVDYGKGSFGALHVVSVAGQDPASAARMYDPRKSAGNEELRAALVRVTVPRSELRRLS